MASQITLQHFGELFDSALDLYVVDAVSTLTSWLAPIAVALVTIWVILFGYATVRGETGDSMATFSSRALRIALVLAVALTDGLYMSWVVGSSNALLNSLAWLFLKSGGLSTAGTGSIWSLVDQYDAQVEAVVTTLSKDILGLTPPFVNFPNLFAVVLISFGGCIFEVCVLVVACFAKIVLTLTLSLGPAFILTLIFPATSRFFDAWLSKLLSAVMLSAVTFFLAGLSLSITGTFMTSFLGEVNTINFIVAGMVVGVVETLLGVVMIQAPTLAAALTGGAVFQSGIGTISAVLAGGRMAGAWAIGGQAASGGSIRAAGASASPQAFGRGAATAAQSVRRLAYKLAASRGRR